MSPAEAEALFARIPQLAGRRPAEFAISALPGLTNRNYRLRAADADWVLRVPRPATERTIDRAAEGHNQRAAAALGIAPLWAWRDDDGLSLTATLAGRAPRPADFDDPAALDRVAALLGHLHRSGAEFRGRVEIGAEIARYEALLPARRRGEFAARRRAAGPALARVADAGPPAVPSHNDPILDNLLFDGARTWLIDWEFSAMASPCWDLATFANAAALDAAGCRRLLASYCATGTPVEESLFYAWREGLALLADCWMAALLDGPARESR